MSEKIGPVTASNSSVKPRIIIHGGAGNLTRKSVPKERYDKYQTSLKRIIALSAEFLDRPGTTALDAATFAVSQLEDDPLYNSGKGAVFTTEGQNELECSIMVSNGYKKRGVGCMMLKHVKNPIKLARELLIKGEENGGGGAKDHCQYSGEFVERLAKDWGLEIVDQSYFFTQPKWDEHKRGLKEKERQKELSIPTDELTEWERENFISLGTCGAVVLDSFGTICVATSTGGLTNKVPGRIGDTPTMGAGYWAEEWTDLEKSTVQMLYQSPSPVTSPIDHLSRGNVQSLISDCLPSFTTSPAFVSPQPQTRPVEKPTHARRAAGISSTGNGDTFIRLCASRTAAAYSRFNGASLSRAVSWMAGPGGELQKSAGDRWGKVHEGVGGMIGIELVDKKTDVIFDYNCGGMFRAWTEEDGSQKSLIFREDNWESGPQG